MNLYIINEHTRGSVFGIGTYIQEIVYALKYSGIYVCVIELISEKQEITIEEIDDVSYWYFPATRMGLRSKDDSSFRRIYFHNILYLLQLYIKDRTNLVFLLNYHHNTDFAEGLKVVFDCKIVSVAHFSEWGFSIFDNLSYLRKILQGHYLNELEEKINREFEEERDDYAKADYIICLSNYMREVLCMDYGFSSEKIKVIPNGLRDATDNSVNIASLRKKWYLEENEKLVLFVGRIDEVKGVSYLLRAFSQVLKSYPECRLLIVGNGVYDQYMLEAQPICLRVTFTGFLNRKELYELYSIAEMGIVPSLFEPFGYVPVEMMMHQLPIVATATSGLNEVVDESCGLKVPLTVSANKVEIDTDLLAQKIIYLLQNPTEAKLLGKNGRNRYLEKYSSQIFGENMMTFYKSLFLI